jgi:hypothetical protein
MERLSSTALAVAKGIHRLRAIVRMNGDVAGMEAAFRTLAITGAPSDGVELSVLARQLEVTAQALARVEESIVMCRTALASLRRALECRPTTAATPASCRPTREDPSPRADDDESSTVFMVWPGAMHNGKGESHDERTQSRPWQ